MNTLKNEVPKASAYNWQKVQGVQLQHCETFTENGLKGIRTEEGTILLPALFDDILETSLLQAGDLLAVKQNGLWGIARADGEGTWVHQPHFDYVGFVSNLTPVRKDGKWGVLNVETASYLIPLECDAVYLWAGHLFLNNTGTYIKDGKYGVIRPDGHFTAPIFEDVEAEYETLLKVKLEGVWGYLDANDQFTTDEDAAFWGCFEVD